MAYIDLSTYRRIPWEKNVPFFLVYFLDPDTKAPISADPRGMLSSITKKAGESGLQCYAGVEYEVRMKLLLRNCFDQVFSSILTSKVCCDPSFDA